jgi:hypothetical protein
MANRDQKPAVHPEGELSESDLDKVAGGQEVVKLGKITVTAKREEPQQVVKLDKVVVTAKREPSDASGTQVAQASTSTKKN